MKIAIGNDHVAVEMKKHIKKYLEDKGYEIVKRNKELRENTQVTPKPITLTKKD